uniref:Ig-like domain-containing protein n=1 Tax=Hippocampus comes TaxID=109280 RepID=A0A3Q2XJE2_HIPCM
FFFTRHCHLCSGGGWARSEEVHIVWGVLGDNCSLPCTAQVKPGVQYLSVSWYKLRGNPPTPQRRGLVLRDLPDGAVERYVSLTREVILNNDTNDILLPNVTCRDNIAYKCRLYAPVGERNLEGEVVLKLSGATYRKHSTCCTAVPNFEFTSRHLVDLWSDSVTVIAVALCLLLFLFSFRLCFMYNSPRPLAKNGNLGGRKKHFYPGEPKNPFLLWKMKNCTLSNCYMFTEHQNIWVFFSNI